MEWAQLFAEKEQFPDEVEIAGPNGEKLQLGELRKQFGRLADFTQHTQKLSEEMKQAQARAEQVNGQLSQYQQALAQREAALQQTQAQLARAMRQEGVDPRQAGRDDLSAFREDPTFAPFVSLVESQRDTITKINSTVDQLRHRLNQDEVAINAWRYQQQIQAIQGRDPDVKMEEFAKFAQDHYSKGVDLDQAYKLFAHDRLLEKAAKDAEQRGYEKAKAERTLPPMPGRRPASRLPERPELPASLDERMAMAAQDPQILEGLEVGIAELRNGG